MDEALPGYRPRRRGVEGAIGRARWRGGDPRRARTFLLRRAAGRPRPAWVRARGALRLRSSLLDGEALWTEPLYVRRLSLASIIPPRSGILLSEDYTGDGAELFRIACEQELEGIVSKRLDKPYRGGRSRSWLKTKCVLSDAFVIIGHQPSSGARRTTIGALHVATFDGQVLRYAGAVGTGCSEAVAAMLREKLDEIAASRCAVAGLKVKGAVWVAPDLRARSPTAD